MRTVKDTLFSQFKCLADKCPDTCCTGWEIDVDEDSLNRFKEATGELKDKLNKAIDYKKGIIKYTKEGVCALLREDGLCSLVCDYGEDILCEICHTYPRHVEEYDGVREWSLALSCPEVVRMVLEAKTIEFDAFENADPEPLYDDFEEFDYMLYSILSDSREVMFKHLRKREVSIFTRMSFILDFAYDIQIALDDGEYFKMQELIDRYDTVNLTDGYKSENHDFSSNKDIISYIQQNYHILNELERLRDAWDDVLSSGRNNLNNVDLFLDTFNPDDREIENIVISLIYTYFVGAVYDDYVYAKAAMCVFIAIMMSYFSYMDYDNRIYMISSMAREVEHSDDNLNALEEYFNQYV